MLSCSAGFKVFLVVLACGMLVGLAAVAPAPPEYVASTLIWEQRPPSIAETSASGSKPESSKLNAERSGDAEPADPAMANRHSIASPADGDPRQAITSANLLLAVLEREDVAAQLDGKLASEALERLRQRLEVTTTTREGNGRRIVVRYHDRTAERALVLCRAIAETYVAEARNAFARIGTLTPVEAEQRAAKAKQRVEAIQAEIDRLLRDALPHDDATRQEQADRPSASQPSEDTRATGAHWPRSERRSPWSAYEDVYGSRYVPPEAGSTPAPDSDYEFGRAVHGQAVEIPPTVPGAPSQPPIGTAPRGPSHHNNGEVARPGASQLQGRSRAPAPRPHDGRRAGDGRPSEPSQSVADRLRALRQERARLLETLTPAHPKVKYLDQWIKDLENLRDSGKRLPSGNADFQTRESTIDRSDEHSREHTSSPSSSRNVPDSSNDQHRSEQQAPWLRLPPVDAEPTESAGESEPGNIEQPEPGASVRENAPVLPRLPADGGPQPDGRQRSFPPAEHQRQPMSADSAAGPALGGSTSQAEKEASPLDRSSAEEEQSASESGAEVKARSLPQNRLAEYKRLREQLREAIESHERWLAAEIEARQLQTLQENATVEIVSPARIVAERNLRVLPHRLFRAVLVSIGVAAAAAGLTLWKRRKLLDAADAGESLGLPVLLLSGNDELVLQQPTKRRASWSYRLAVGATFVVAASTIFLIARDPALRQEFRDRPLTATARAVDRILPL